MNFTKKAETLNISLIKLDSDCESRLLPRALKLRRE